MPHLYHILRLRVYIMWPALTWKLLIPWWKFYPVSKIGKRADCSESAWLTNVIKKCLPVVLSASRGWHRRRRALQQAAPTEQAPSRRRCAAACMRSARTTPLARLTRNAAGPPAGTEARGPTSPSPRGPSCFCCLTSPPRATPPAASSTTNNIIVALCLHKVLLLYVLTKTYISLIGFGANYLITYIH